jgi:CheY-like chemotaxis protein
LTPSASTPNASTIGTKGIVLLVEDNLVNQKVAKHMIERWGWRVDIAANGQEGLDAVQRKHYDLVLMDCQMPEVDGFQATEEIRAMSGPLAEIPIVAMTANAMEGDRDRCLEAGMDDYITKPIVGAELMRVLNRYAIGTPQSATSQSTGSQSTGSQGPAAQSPGPQSPKSMQP